MKPIRFLTVAFILLGMVATASALTPAGTDITNQAVGNYDDANGNAMAEVTSNEVVTEVAQVGGTDVDPATDALTIEPSTVAEYGVMITNTGNGADTYDLTYAVTGTYTGAYTVQLWKDLDMNGSIGGSDVQMTGVAGVYSTTELAMSGEFYLVVRVENTDNAPDGDAPVVTLTAESQFDDTKKDTGVYTTTINTASLVITMSTDNSNPQPGQNITYTVCAENGAGAATAHNVVFTNLIPDYTSYVDDSILLGSTEISDEDDVDVGNYGATPTTVTVVMGDIAAGETVCVSFTVLVDSDVPAGTVIDNDPEIDYENGEGDAFGPETPPDGSGNGDETIEQVYAVSLSTSDTVTYTQDPGDVITLTFTVTNDGNGSDNFDLTYTSSDVTWLFYIGSVVEGEEITNSGVLAQAGTQAIIAVGTVPAGTADQTVDSITFTATSVDDPGGTAASGDLGETVNVTAPLLLLVKTVTHSGSGSAVTYGENDANSAAPATVMTYTVVVQNWGTGEATDIIVTDVVPTNTTYVADSATGGAGTPGESGGSVTWNIASIAGDTNTGDSTYPEVTLTFQVTIN